METKDFLTNLLVASDLSNDRVYEVIKEFCKNSTEDVLRIYSYLTGYTNFPEIPKTSKVRNNATFKEYCLATDTVYYTYNQEETVQVSDEDLLFNDMVFETWEDFRKFNQEHNGDNTIRVYYKSSNGCPLWRWMKDQ